MKTIEELQKEIDDYKKEVESLKEALSYKQELPDDANDQIEDLEEEEQRLNYLLDEYESKVVLDTSNLMEEQKAELLKIAQGKFSLQELEEMFGGNSFTL